MCVYTYIYIHTYTYTYTYTYIYIYIYRYRYRYRYIYIYIYIHVYMHSIQASGQARRWVQPFVLKICHNPPHALNSSAWDAMSSFGIRV